jgi:hypothetical protein
MTVRRPVAVGFVCGVKVSTILVDEENDEVNDSERDDVEDCDGINVEDDEEDDIEAAADAELGLEIPIVVGKKILFFVAQQSCELNKPQHQLPSSSHSDI